MGSTAGSQKISSSQFVKEGRASLQDRQVSFLALLVGKVKHLSSVPSGTGENTAFSISSRFRWKRKENNQKLGSFQCHCIVRTLGNVFSSPLGTVYLLAAGQSLGELGGRICLGSPSPVDLGSPGYVFGRNRVMFRDCQRQIFCAC